MLSAEDIQSNWKKHGDIVNRALPKERVEKVLDMYSDLGDEVVMAPASGKESFHNAFPGGYIDHVNRVVKFSLGVQQLWKTSNIPLNFSEEELIFSALFHDLGKLGVKGLPNYLPQTNNWRKENLGENYSYNQELDFMLIQDRSLYTLQHYGISLTQNEYLAIKTHDGLYDETNKPYYISYNSGAKFKTSLPHILHQADLMATEFERLNFVKS